MVTNADFTPPLQPTHNPQNESSIQKNDPIDHKTKEIAKEVIGTSTKTLESKSTSLSSKTNQTTINPESTLISKTHDVGLGSLKIDQSDDEFEDFISAQEDDDFNPDFESTAWTDIDSANEEIATAEIEKSETLEEKGLVSNELESNELDVAEKLSNKESVNEQVAISSEADKAIETKLEDIEHQLTTKMEDRNEISEALDVAKAEVKEAAKEFAQIVKELVGVVKGENGENIGIFKDVLAGELKAFNEFKNELKDRALNLEHPNDVGVDDKELAKHLGNLAIIKEGRTLVIPEALRRQFGNITHAVNANHVPNWNSQTTINLSNLAPNALHTVQNMTSQDQAKLHSLAKNYLTLSTKMFLLEFLLQQSIDKEKTSHTQHPAPHVRVPEAAAQAANVQATAKPALEVKEDAKAKTTDRSILPDFTTSAQRKKERARQQKQDDEDKQITKDSIKRKNESYRQDQERLQDDFIKKSDISLKRKSSEHDKKKP